MVLSLLGYKDGTRTIEMILVSTVLTNNIRSREVILSRLRTDVGQEQVFDLAHACSEISIKSQNKRRGACQIFRILDAPSIRRLLAVLEICRPLIRGALLQVNVDIPDHSMENSFYVSTEYQTIFY